MKIFIPNTKTHLVLTKPWSFRLYSERRNFEFGKKLCLGGIYDNHYGWAQFRTHQCDRVTLAAGTILLVNRVYIRQGTSETYDSVTFWLKKRTKGQVVHGRFWAKLADVNQMECEVWFPGVGDIPAEERVSRIALLFEE